MLEKSFEGGKQVISKIEEHDHKAYFVGGCVRDLLLHRPIGDIDIATSALPEQIKQIFPQVIPVGIEHGTVIVRHQHISYEVTTFRLDGKYSDQRHPDSVQFIDRIDEDLARRDFTINALAMDIKGHITDLFHGQRDIEQQVIQTVGNGYDRFMEDPLRIIRALRFSSQLGFSIDKDTLTAINEVKEQIETIAVERITVEFTKLFAGRYIQDGINYLKSTGIYKHLPILSIYPHIIEDMPSKLEPLQTFGEVLAHFHYLERAVSISKWVKAWRCSNQIKNEAMALIQAIDHYEQSGLDEWLVYQLNPSFDQGFIRLVDNLLDAKPIKGAHLLKMRQQLVIQSKHDIAIGGKEIIELFPTIHTGPWIRDLLNNIEREIVLRRLENNKMNIKEWIACNPPVIN